MNKNRIKNQESRIKAVKIPLILCGIVLLAAGCNQAVKTNSKTGTVTVAGHEVKVSIADTDAARQQGLSGRNVMPRNEGMLFVFDQPGQYPFWMKGMEFPLDFIWINQNQVIGIFANVPIEHGVVDSALHTYMPEGMFDSVLEVNANWAADNGIKVGDRVDVRL
jgi:hypothetical protein